MENRFINLQRVGFALLIVFLTGYIIVIGKNVLVSLTFAAFFALLLMPICAFFERWISWRIPAIFLTFLVVLIPLAGILTLLSMQLVDVIQNLSSISEKLQTTINDIFAWINQKIGFSKTEGENWISENSSKMLEGPLSFLGQGLSSSTAFIANLILTLIYTFFFLLYRSAFKQFALIQFSPERRIQVADLLDRIKRVAQKYLSGILTVMLILGVLNSIALWLIGIQYALFWGFIAGVLAIIPYVGTFIGGLLPFLYALATTGTVWQPIAVVISFNLVQTLENNFITPKVAGSSVKINPFAAVLALIVGGAMWGIAGLVLSLPIIAVTKVLMEQVDVLKPFSFLLGSSVYGNEDKFKEQYDEEKYRLSTFFSKQSTK